MFSWNDDEALSPLRRPLNLRASARTVRRTINGAHTTHLLQQLSPPRPPPNRARPEAPSCAGREPTPEDDNATGGATAESDASGQSSGEDSPAPTQAAVQKLRQRVGSLAHAPRVPAVKATTEMRFRLEDGRAAAKTLMSDTLTGSVVRNRLGHKVRPKGDRLKTADESRAAILARAEEILRPTSPSADAPPSTLAFDRSRLAAGPSRFAAAAGTPSPPSPPARAAREKTFKPPTRASTYCTPMRYV
ncbi:hypothetical protein DFH09DRAFT_1322786 [Mycena vulgaris]|nr:hypothetical protein DFH09DRAFT_1322786 [Mycena vulgaris]